ncbi:peptide deformylase [Loktanella fryxellensis]|uniref:Peptide deformylase n=1 Tax=Loktanella fryxellensis TaxID=245187 RepID=A0A1H8AX54_9RHOB|nr:peptide deformylase [Loktanella fryxellensis]SEM75133.1 peptide deformylase [Loktanella fryxellensis]
MRPILTDPDPALRTVCAPVTAFDTDLAVLAAEMLDVMYAAPGRGLAAPQIGVLSRVFVMDADWKTGTPAPQVFVNPQIVASGETLVACDEACLSIPGRTVSVTRPGQVTLRWQGLDGAVAERVFDGVEAVIVQHERDHLDGVLCTDLGVDV